MQRRAQIGLNKGEAHHALKNVLRIGRQGETRDRPPRDSTTGWRASICCRNHYLLEH